ncbi:tRNA wybutosine-synthesizing protein 2/3/4 isoform X2 [Asparagus officinalis]|uniref:tRNA wybutosine-synthesizing protein 2/3/4 isoform X2 n=1 Tax=Asparagus officinalis TaxID=4686 RepID=UPI00098E6B26|nr:tRNA wybutosine-synthesizing protein 2/3/4 isoform X2 [Asparagus officinalis]
MESSSSSFQKRKSETLASITSQTPDKSPKGFLDAPIIPLIDAINLHPSFFTTSSCSGRISILSHPKNPNPNPNGRIKKKAGGGRWIFITHDPADADAVADVLFGEGGGGGEGDLVFRFEPLIVAVECADVESAQMLVSAAISCGFRESGITSIQKRVIIAIRCSIRLEVPLGQVGSVLVSKEYVRYLVGIANEKMEANRKRTDSLLHVLQIKVSGEGRFPQFEAKQNDSLSDQKLNESDSLQYCIQDQIKDKSVSGTGRLSNADKNINSSCEDSLKYFNPLCGLEVGYTNEGGTNANLNSELSGTPECSVSADLLTTVGEPAEKLLLWGQSACTLNRRKEIIVFGGFGGVGRHARRSYSLMLDPRSGQLHEIDAKGPPSPRMGHTSSMVGDQMFIIGGRGGPNQILNDVWVLHTSENRWVLLECTGSMFQPRHRHAAVAVGSSVYVFGGLDGEVVLSSMNVLNTETSQWSEISIQGEWPSARHSHSLIADGTLLYMFGGYDSEKALGDLYSFDTRMSLWKKEKTSGRDPLPRFSHCMFIYKRYLGILGGCPIRQHNEELSLLNLEHKIWMHVKVDSVDRNIWVRSSTCVIDDNIVIIGGGTSCYAFGTKFNQLMKINLQPVDSLYSITYEKVNEPPAKFHNAFDDISGCKTHLQYVHTTGDGHCIDAKYFTLQVEKKYAKLAKDVLKKFGWLDLSRKVQPSGDDRHINLPVTRSFSSFYKKELNSVDAPDDFCQQGVFTKKGGSSLDEISLPMASRFLVTCGGTLQINDVSCSRKVPKAPQKTMKESISTLLRKKGMPVKLLEQLPTRWERLGDIVVLPVNSLKDAIWNSIGDELWPIVAKSLGAQRLARQGRILPNGTRDSSLEILVGDDGWVKHQENGIIYSFDATKCMFSSGNLSEKLRMAHLDCRDEIVVDLFAGIGYFVLPFLVKAKAKFVYACEWNPHAIKALRHNIDANFVADRCIILEGDNRVTAPKAVADRVCLGLLPSSEISWGTAVKALRAEGGVLHIHENVKDSEENSWLEYVIRSISDIAQSEGLCWDVSVQHLERVKWYGPHVRHIVADVRCQKV